MDIRYSTLISKSMRFVVREAFKFAVCSGDCNFVVSFFTCYDDVELSEELKSQYPEQMTITLNNQYSDLEVRADCFIVTLSFSGVAHRITVPFAALISFYDRDAKFSLEFKQYEEDKNSLFDDIGGNFLEENKELSEAEEELGVLGGYKSAKIVDINDYLKNKKT